MIGVMASTVSVRDDEGKVQGRLRRLKGGRTMSSTYRWLALSSVLAVALAGSQCLPLPSDARTIGVTPVVDVAEASGGGRIAFASDRNDGKAQIFIMNADGTNPVQVTQGPDEHLWPALRPDGGLMASMCLASQNASDVCVFEPDGTHETRLTTSGKAVFPSWSPDGRQLAFTDGFDQNSSTVSGDIYVMDGDGSNVTQLTYTHADAFPAWSPDGKLIAFSSARDGGRSGIYVMNADGVHQQKLTQGHPQDFAPAWSPDGRRIAFFSSPDLKKLVGDIYVMTAAGKNPTQLTHTDKAALPAWAPDDRRIVFTALVDDHSEIDVMNADGSHLTRLTKGQATDAGAAWEPIAGGPPSDGGSTQSSPSHRPSK
jgi:TolB protein